MAGVWKLEDGALTIEPFAPLSQEVRERAESEAARLTPHVFWQD